MTAAARRPEPAAPPGRRTAGAAWVMVSVGAATVAQLGLLVALGRTLSATEFGVAAGLIALGSLPRMIVEAVLPAPVIQRPAMTPATARTAATMSMLATLAIGAMLWLGAAPIAALFDIDDMERWIRWISLSLPIHGLATVPQALLQRELRFRQASAIDTVAFVLGYLVGGGVALAVGAGVGAVAVALIAEAAVRVVLSMLTRPVLPTLRPHTGELREMSRFAASTGLGSTLNLLATRGDYVMISRLLGPVSLAAYTQAYQLAYNPGLILGRVSNRWLFPVLARDHDAPKQQIDLFMTNLLGLGFFMGAAATVTVVLAPEAIRLLFGSGWDAAVAPLQVLALGLPFRVMYTICDAHAKATGRVGRRAVVQAGYAAAVVALAALGATASLGWAAAGVVVAIALNYGFMLHLAVGDSPVGWSDIARAHRLVPVGVAASAAGLAAVVPMARSLGWSDLLVMLSGLTAVAVFLALAVALLLGRRSRATNMASRPAVLAGTGHDPSAGWSS